MTPDEFVKNVAKLVAGLQVPVSMAPREMFGTAFKPWQALLEEANGGFGWTDADKCEEAFRAILAKNETPFSAVEQSSVRFADHYDHQI